MGWSGAPSKRQIFIPPPATLLFIPPDFEAEDDIQLPEFRVMTPDSRLRTKVTLLFSFPQDPDLVPPIDLTGAAATLYLYELEQDYGGSSAQLIPSVALEGTFAAPTPIPKFPFLDGYSKEFVTAGDAIGGLFSVSNPSALSGFMVMLQARWQPDGQRLPDDEWDEIKHLCALNASPVTAS